jgi:ribose/xylose/arabinose/galactoside ABC-type transport system permease subunit
MIAAVGASTSAMAKGGFLHSRAGSFLGRNWAACFLVAMVVVFSVTGRGFLSIPYFQNILHLSTMAILLAAAETFVIVTGGIDLSVGYIVGFSSVCSAQLMLRFQSAGLPPGACMVLGALGALALCLVPGVANGLVITRLKVPPFIATLGMGGIMNGLTLLWCQGFPVQGLPGPVSSIGNSYLLYIDPGKSLSFFSKPDYIPDSRIREILRLLPNSLIFLALVVLVLWFLLRRTRFGRHTYAIGGNMDAALRAGINVDAHIVKIYALSALLAGLGGAFNVFQTGIGNYTTFSSLYEFMAVAAVVIGGASLTGGKGRLAASIIGVLVLKVLESGLSISGVPPFYRYIAVGVLLTLAVIIDQLFPELTEKGGTA